MNQLRNPILALALILLSACSSGPSAQAPEPVVRDELAAVAQWLREAARIQKRELMRNEPLGLYIRSAYESAARPLPAAFASNPTGAVVLSDGSPVEIDEQTIRVPFMTTKSAKTVVVEAIYRLSARGHETSLIVNVDFPMANPLAGATRSDLEKLLSPVKK